MHYFQVPADIQMCEPISKAPLQGPDGNALPAHTFRDFVVTVLLNDPKWMQGGYASIRSARKIDELVSGLAPGDGAVLDDADWERLNGVCESPTNGQFANYTTLGMRHLFPFLEAIVSATDKQAG